MRRVLGVIAMMSVMTVCASVASAQQADPFENEFKSFREKLEAARAEKKDAPATAAPADAAAPNMPDVSQPATAGDNPLVVPLDGATSAAGAANNPLGPAANLPLNKNAPAVSNALTGAQSPEEMQALMEADAAAQQKKMEEAAFQGAIKMLLPMSTDQIRRTYDAFKLSREAAETPITMPTPKQVVETISLDPSDEPAIVRTAPGYVTTVAFLDSSGAPWPIQDISWAGKFTITPPEAGGHILRITPASAHGVGNASIRMVDLIAPITLQLRTGIDEVYYRMDARIPKAGPLAKTPLIDYSGLSAVAGKDDAMIGVLDGTPPTNAEKLKVNGVDGRTVAWKVEDKIYLRTPLTLLSPGWEASAASADGTNVYAFSNTPVMLLSDDGRMVRAQIGEAVNAVDNEAIIP